MNEIRGRSSSPILRVDEGALKDPSSEDSSEDLDENNPRGSSQDSSEDSDENNSRGSSQDSSEDSDEDNSRGSNEDSTPSTSTRRGDRIPKTPTTIWSLCQQIENSIQSKPELSSSIK